MYSQDQLCDSNHAECVLFSQSLVPTLKTKAYFLQDNDGCFQLCNNPRFPVRSQSMEVKIMRIDSVTHRLVRELIADCLEPTFKTHVRSFINKDHVVKNATKLRGGCRIFFRRGCTRLLLYFNTNKPHSFFFFCRIPVVLENRRSSRRGGGCAPPAPSP